MNTFVRLAEPFWRSVGQRDLELNLDEGARVADVLKALIERYPALEKELASTPPHLFAEEQEASPETPLTDGCHVYLMWPVAGG